MTFAPPLRQEEVDYARLIGSDRVSGELYTDPRVFNDEMDRIWRRRWLYVGHESEIPNSGDYRTRVLGGVPVIFTRTRTGRIVVLFNRCPHRGTQVCVAEQGSSLYFRCPYHGWTFHNDGSNARITFPDAYSELYGKQDLSMSALPSVDTFRGLIFASFVLESQSLSDYLGRAKTLIDLAFDRSPTGQIRIAGVQRCAINANWKMLMDNASDQYHPRFSHQSALRLDQRLRDNVRETEGSEGIGLLRDLGNGITEMDNEGQHREAGHGYVEPLPDNIWSAYLRQVAEALGQKRADEVFGKCVPHISFFPNMLLLQNEFRVYIPVSLRLTYQESYFYDLEGVDPELNRHRRRRHEMVQGVAGFVGPDDFDVYERNQIGLEAGVGGPEEALDVSRGMHRETTDASGCRVSAKSDDELGLRVYWSAYKESMLHTEPVGDSFRDHVLHE